MFDELNCMLLVCLHFPITYRLKHFHTFFCFVLVLKKILTSAVFDKETESVQVFLGFLLEKKKKMWYLFCTSGTKIYLHRNDNVLSYRLFLTGVHSLTIKPK